MERVTGGGRLAPGMTEEGEALLRRMPRGRKILDAVHLGMKVSILCDTDAELKAHRELAKAAGVPDRVTFSLTPAERKV